MDTPPEKSLAEIIEFLAQDGHASHAIWVAATLERNLEWLLQNSMPGLSNTLKEKMFRGYGPLSSFSAKIDLSRALGLIPASLRRELHVIREVRNEFAHSNNRTHFGSPEIVTLLKKFPDYSVKIKPVEFYLKKLQDCLNVLNPIIDSAAMANALRKGPGLLQSLLEKDG